MAISQASVTYYADNNFDINNIPANPAVLAAASTTGNLEVINCLPFSGQTEVKIRVKSFAKLNTTSYLKIEFTQDGFAWYGIVNGFVYTSMDIVEIIRKLPDTEIYNVAKNVKRVHGYSQHMDSIPVGRGMGRTLPEAVKAAGAVGVMLNHAERKLTLEEIKRRQEKCNRISVLSTEKNCLAVKTQISARKIIKEY